jgi:hypothetical protein
MSSEGTNKQERERHVNVVIENLATFPSIFKPNIDRPQEAVSASMNHNSTVGNYQPKRRAKDKSS